MIDELHVTNLALIREADLSLSSGLTVLTGETGAGKTALLSALKLLLGERSDASLVREGEVSAQVEARFFNGVHDTEGFTVTRRIGSDGRSRVRIDGGLGSVRELAARTAPLMDLCGQHEHQRLLDAATHVGMVDAWAHAGIAGALEAYRRDLAAARAAARELERVEAAARTEGFQLEDARFAVDRIDEVDPLEGELEELEETLPRAEHAEALAACAHEASEALSGEGGALDPLNGAIAELSRMGGVDGKLAEFADTLSSAAITLEDVAADLRRYRDSVDFDPEELARLQERYAALKGLLRQFGPRMEDVFRRRAEASDLLSLVSDGEVRIARARRAVDEAEAALAQSAKALSRARNVAGPRFCREVGRQMARLEMGRAELVWEARRLPRERWSEAGPDACELLYRTGPGLTPRPLRRIASGGELSRVMLASMVVLGEADGVDTLVFDEVDAGVGGAVARSLAAVLADLARTHQVIVVTHVAQVAVVAHEHYVVSKSADDVPVTVIEPVCGEDRVREVARMLSGDVGEASLAHARQMLADAGTLA
ncbi:DNA repair protein RecN [Collinsella intestinalis]|uniref:DNA repair protein RecN n=1 Tax=Collinsella intestinalis TaxID=147207 RepID=UPI0025A3B667|nr:DNA repair protein RecN [Collinsella intestinalis]MDM8163749.1 DNA repair protein RecN [Collinsella intestinalis]